MGSFVYGQVYYNSPYTFYLSISKTQSLPQTVNIYQDNTSNLSDFIQVNVQMNAGNPDYIRPLDNDVKDVFNKDKNKYLKTGKIQRWIVKDDSGNFIGRIAAFVNPRYRNKGDKFKVGGIGYFDCIDDQVVANLLFDTAKEWLMSQGVEAMDGPINLGERDRWWGLLTEGFQPPPYGLNYNPPYYEKLFTTYGWQTFYEQICWQMPLSKTDQLIPKFYDAHKRFDQDPTIHREHYEKNKLEKYAQDFCTVYNKAWASHQGGKEMTLQQGIKTFQMMKPIIDPHLIWFVYKDNEPISMWLNLPDLNQGFKHFDGKFHLINKLRFLWMKSRKRFTKFVGLAYGVVPEFQGTGVDYYMIVEGERAIKKYTNYNLLELQWQGDFNPKMLNISKNIGAQKCRTLKTMRYIFDQSVPFERHPIL